METFGSGMPSCHPMRARHITMFCNKEYRNMSIAKAASGYKVTPRHELCIPCNLANLQWPSTS